MSDSGLYNLIKPLSMKRTASAKKIEWYDLAYDPNETKNITTMQKEIAGRMIEKFTAWNNRFKQALQTRIIQTGR